MLEVSAAIPAAAVSCAGNRLWKRFHEGVLDVTWCAGRCVVEQGFETEDKLCRFVEDGDRLFGQDAFKYLISFAIGAETMANYVSRVLDFLLIRPLLSKSFKQGLLTLKSYRTTLQSQPLIFETARKTVGFRQSDGMEWSTKELVAMQFAYIKLLTEQVANEKVADVVVAVPP